MVSARYAILLHAPYRRRAAATDAASGGAQRAHHLWLLSESNQAERCGIGGVGAHTLRAARCSAAAAESADALRHRARSPARPLAAARHCARTIDDGRP